jgi:hypothetical protein
MLSEAVNNSLSSWRREDYPQGRVKNIAEIDVSLVIEATGCDRIVPQNGKLILHSVAKDLFAEVR